MDRFTELMQDLGIHVAGVLNPGMATPAPDVIQPPLPPAAAGIATTPSPDVMQPPPQQGWVPQGVPFPNTQSGPPAPAPVAMPGYDPTGPWQPRGQPFPNTQSGQPTLAPTPMPGYDPTGPSAPAQPRVAGGPVPSATLQMPIDLGLIPPNPAMARDDTQPYPGVSTQQVSGYPPSAGPDPSRQGEYGPAGSRGTTGSRGAPGPAANGAPSSAGQAPSVSGAGPAAPPSSPQARVQDALTPKGDRFGITPRTYQLMGVIGATLLMGSRPGESPAATMGRALGAGMMYDNFARLSDQEAGSNERVLAIREKQLGQEGTKIGQQGKLTDARIAQIKADIVNDTEKLKHIANADERAALESKIRRDSASIGLEYARPMAEAELDTKRAALGTAQDRHRKLIGDIFEKNKDIGTGGVNIDSAATQYRAMGIGKPLSPADTASAQRALAAARTKGAQEYARVRQEIIVRSMQNGWQLPPL